VTLQLMIANIYMISELIQLLRFSLEYPQATYHCIKKKLIKNF
jgi:hypothetical protein